MTDIDAPEFKFALYLCIYIVHIRIVVEYFTYIRFIKVISIKPLRSYSIFSNIAGTVVALTESKSNYF